MNIVDINLENAQQLLIDESAQRPVLIDFWADWCGPCKSLMPILEKLAQEYDGAFLLAKVNADEQQMIASQFGVRSLPTVVLMKDGQPLDGFTGAQSEVQVREFLAKYLPQPWEAPLGQARELMQAGDFSAALPLLREVYEAAGRPAAVACWLAECQLELKRVDNAEAILGQIKLADQTAQYEQLMAKIALHKAAAKTPELAALEAEHQANPDDLAVRYRLAVQLNHEQDYRAALEQLLSILRADRQFAEGEARKTMTAIITALGKGDPLAIEYQRKLFTLLY